MDLTTRYLGLSLRSPLVVSASPLSDEMDSLRQMEYAGAAAVVLPSLFEEQLTLERHELHHHLTHHAHSHPEALTYSPEPDNFNLGPEEYLKHIARARKAVNIPIIASLNGKSVGGWTEYARRMEQAGAHGLELNIYSVPTDMGLPGSAVEQKVLDIVQAVKAVTRIPVAVKLSPFFSNFANMAKRLEQTGAQALVLFNRFYQPDIELDQLEIRPHVLLSTPQAMRLPLTWIGILHGRLNLDLAATSGIHSGEDVIKMLMVGANVTMLCSVLYREGISYLRQIEKEMMEWMEQHEYQSVRQMHGSMSQMHCHDPGAFERAQYMKAVSGSYPA